MKIPVNFTRVNGPPWLAVLCLCLMPAAHAQSGQFALCAQKYPGNDIERLKCYDSALPVMPASATDTSRSDVAKTSPSGGEAPVKRRSYLTKAWNLDDRTSHDSNRMGRLIPHRQSYLLVRKTFNVNNQPTSHAPAHSALTASDLDALETKFQLSFKADISNQQDIDFLELKTMRLWGAYTQQSNWQMFNTRNSSIFRETNYEPELIASFGTGKAEGLKLVNFGLAHQSNGQNLPASRSWNRIYLQGGWEWDNIAILARGWYRIPENILKDDNPDITDYIGRAEVVMHWEEDDKSQAVALLLRDNLRLGYSRSFVQADWSMPVALGKSARLHAQMTSGFGESLIDYNHRQTTLGLGFSFREW